MHLCSSQVNDDYECKQLTVCKGDKLCFIGVLDCRECVVYEKQSIGNTGDMLLI